MFFDKCTLPIIPGKVSYNSVVTLPVMCIVSTFVHITQCCIVKYVWIFLRKSYLLGVTIRLQFVQFTSCTILVRDMGCHHMYYCIRCYIGLLPRIITVSGTCMGLSSTIFRNRFYVLLCSIDVVNSARVINLYMEYIAHKSMIIIVLTKILYLL